jgi:hypothetical protein
VTTQTRLLYGALAPFMLRPVSLIPLHGYAVLGNRLAQPEEI